MTTVYHPADLPSIEEILDYIRPRLENYISGHYFGASDDLQQDLVQEGLIAVWHEYQRGKLINLPNWWMQAAKTGARRACERLRCQTGKRVKRDGKTVVEECVTHEHQFGSDYKDDALIFLEATTHRNPGPRDPEGGAIDARIDFERLVARVFAVLSDEEAEAYYALMLHLAEGRLTTKEFCAEQGWSYGHYWIKLRAFREAFAAADGRELPKAERGAQKYDPAQVRALYMEGYGSQRIARIVGCSVSRADQLIQQFKKEGLPAPRSTRRLYHYSHA